MWLDSDRDWAMALHDLEADTCPGCGQPRHESMDPEYDGAYIADVVRCHACASMSRKSSRFLDDGGDSHGLIVTVSRR